MEDLCFVVDELGTDDTEIELVETSNGGLFLRSGPDSDGCEALLSVLIQVESYERGENELQGESGRRIH